VIILSLVACPEKVEHVDYDRLAGQWLWPSFERYPFVLDEADLDPREQVSYNGIVLPLMRRTLLISSLL